MDLLANAAARAALGLAVLVNPCLVARLLLRGRPPLHVTVAIAGTACVFLNTLVPVLLHLAGWPVTAPTLAAAHAALAALLLAAAAPRHIDWRPRLDDADRPALAMGAVFILLVVPYTHLAGIDTYKWQDLATSVQVEHSVPWLIHPLALLGFTPRSYPSAQPLLLATVQILGALGVEGGYFLVSVICGLTGIGAALMLGRRLFGGPAAAGFALFYAFSPVFMRYNHWATGRGLFLALYPLFLLAAVSLPRLAAWAGYGLLALLLCLSHKTGIIAVALVSASLPASLLLPRRDRRWLILALAVPSVAAALVIAGHGWPPAAGACVTGFLRRAVTRFGWLVPAAAAGLALSAGWFSNPAWRRLLPAALLTFPLAFPPTMYGALLALPFVVQAATAGLQALAVRRPAARRGLAVAAVALSLAGALGIVIHRSAGALRHPVWEAARFLESYDPRGPFRVLAPDQARAHIQAYVSGCPRFTVSAGADSRVVVRRPPPLRRDLGRTVREWTDYLRAWTTVSETEVEWYGAAPRLYSFVIDGDGDALGGASCLYDRHGVQILAPAGQRPPPR